MGGVLDSASVQTVLAGLAATGAVEDVRYAEAVHALESGRGERVYGEERARLGAAAPLAVAPETGRLLYALALARRPRLVVEFGTSLGVSTVYLAAALAELGGAGRLIGSELLAEKAERARAALEACGLDAVAEIRVGDALETLSADVGEVELLFLDGSNDLYVPVLALLEPRLADGALVVADLSTGDPHHDRYREYVAGWVGVELPLDAGVTVSVRPAGA